MAGLVIYIDERNYWYLALGEQPDGTDLDHYIELSQIYDGQWFAHERLRKVSSGDMQWDWQYNHPYRLILSMKDGMITGSAHQLDGTHRHAGLSRNAAGTVCSRSALINGV